VKIIKLSSASRSLADYAAELGDDIVVLTDRRKPIAAIVPLRGVDADSVALSGHPGFLKIIARSRDEFRQGRTLSLEAMKAAIATKAPNRRLQPTKARRRSGRNRGASSRLRG
jgi:antitoxin (DNA-binding transcriptional repressor) of toxin-antitoxin stability system